ncbi:MAG: RNA polymerase sigma factor [Acidimicrobiales bacterium]
MTERQIRTSEEGGNAGFTPSDAALVDAAKDGDIEAFGALVARHQKAAIRVAAVAMGSASDADDVAQEAFVKAHRALASFRVDAAFRPWLFRIVTNTARNRLRGDKRHRALTLRTAALNPESHDGEADRAAHLADRTALITAINRLRVDDRLILAYRWYDELSEVEMAEALGCRPGTVKSRLSRAMKRLRSELELESGSAGGISLKDAISDSERTEP